MCLSDITFLVEEIILLEISFSELCSDFAVSEIYQEEHLNSITR